MLLSAYASQCLWFSVPMVVDLGQRKVTEEAEQHMMAALQIYAEAQKNAVNLRQSA